MTARLQIGNSANWEQLYSQSFDAVNMGQGVFAIPEITVPFRIENRYLAVSATSRSAKSSWYFAGFLNQKLQLGLLDGGVPDTNSLRRMKIWLNKITFITLPNFDTEYALTFNAAHWLEDISLIVWRYIGPEPDLTNNLIEALKTDILRIEQKIDAI